SDEQIEDGVIFHGRRPCDPKMARRSKPLRRRFMNAGAMAPDDIRYRTQRAATVTADFYLTNSCTDGIPMWDTGAPNLHRLGDYLRRPANPFNQWEPVDSSAAAIAAQGLWRLGNYLLAARRLHRESRTRTKDEDETTRNASRYRQAALTIANTLFSEA